MENKLEIFYGEDDTQKLNFMNQVFQELLFTFKHNKAPVIDPLLFKALNRVLSDDFKRNPDLVLIALKNVHLILKNLSLQKKLELVQENQIDGFQWTALKIFVWEFKRLRRIYEKFRELQLQKSGSSQIHQMNLNIKKQTQIFTLILLVFREHYQLLLRPESELLIRCKKTEFLQNFSQFNLVEFFVRLYDYEDPTLLRTLTNFLLEILDEKLA